MAELLDIGRTRVFVTYALGHDLQIQLYRRQALTLFVACLAREGETNIIEWSAESFDKIQTFLTQNDQQVHYHGATTVGVYAIVRLLGELRRFLRDFSDDSSPASPSGAGALLSPTRAMGRDRAVPTAQRRLSFPPGAASSGEQVSHPTDQA